MNFGKTLKAVATSLGMFAAGSWIVPCFSLTSVTQIASAVPMSENSNDDTWSGSDVARAWTSAIGSEYDPASQVLVMQSGEDHVPVVLDQVRSEDGRSVGLSYFMVDLSLPVAEVSQQDEEFGVTTGADFVTGRILGALATYQENLANAGCPAKPLPFGHSASDPTDQNELSAAPNNAHILRSEVDE